MLKSKMSDWIGDGMDTMAGISRQYNPRHSLSITNTKGLLNAPGENNCFLNSAVQVLWHLDVFRRSFRLLTGHACMGNSCIFCALKVIFTQFQYSDETALPPDALRKALAETFKDQQRFQLGCMDDAAECFYECPCGASSEPLPFTQMVHYVSATALCSQAMRMRQEHNIHQPVMFSILLQKAGGVGDVRNCPSNCGKSIQLQRKLLNCPEIVSIGLVWDSDQPSIDHIMDVIKNLGTTIKLPYIFQGIFDERARRSTLYLVGIVTYYGKHYSTFFFHTKLRVWIYFDDATVREIGKSWSDVVEKCRRGHYQPLLLLYADPYGTPVSVETAPKSMVMVPGHTGPENSGKFKDERKYLNNSQNLKLTDTKVETTGDISMATVQSLITPASTIFTDAKSVTCVSNTVSPSCKEARKSRSQPRIFNKSRESFDSTSLSSSASSSSVDKVKLRPSRSKSRDRFLSLIRQQSSTSNSSNESVRINDLEDLNTIDRKKPFQGVPIPPDNRFGKQVYTCPKSPKILKSPKMKRSGSLKCGKESLRADIIRYEISDNGSSSHNSMVYNPYHDAQVKDQIVVPNGIAEEGSQKNGQIFRDRAFGQQCHSSQQKLPLGQKSRFDQCVHFTSNWDELQQIHEQWLNEHKQRESYLFPQEQSDSTRCQTHYHQCETIQQCDFPFDKLKRQKNTNQEQFQSDVDSRQRECIEANQQLPSSKPKRMTPKSVKQRNSDKKPVESQSNDEIKFSKSLRRKSLGEVELSYSEELSHIFKSNQEDSQSSQNTSSALPVEESSFTHSDYGKCFNCNNQKSSLPEGFATLPRKARSKGGHAVPSSIISSHLLESQTNQVTKKDIVKDSSCLGRSSSFHEKSARTFDKEANKKSLVIPTALGPVVVENNLNTENDLCDDIRTNYLHSGDSSSNLVVNKTETSFQFNKTNIVEKHNKIEIPAPKQLLSPNSCDRSGDRTNGSPTISYSVTDFPQYGSSFVPLKTLLQKSAAYTAQKYSDICFDSGKAEHPNNNQKNLYTERQGHDNNRDLIDFKTQVQQKQDDENIKRCDSLLQEAERLLDKSMQVEMTGDLATALCLCLNAITRLRSAMDHQNLQNSHRTRVILETKHKACLLKSQSLHRKMISKKEDPSINSLHNSSDGTLDDILSTMVSSLGVIDSGDDLSDSLDLDERKNVHLQKQKLSELYCQRSHYVNSRITQLNRGDREQSRKAGQTDVTTEISQGDPCLEISQKSNEQQMFYSTLQQHHRMEAQRNVNASWQKLPSHDTWTGYDSKPKYYNEHYGYRGQDNATDQFTSDSKGNTLHQASSIAYQAKQGEYNTEKRTCDGYENYMKKRHEELMWLENKTREPYHQVHGTQMSSYAKDRYNCISDRAYGDLNKIGHLSRSSPNITLSNMYMTGYARHWSDQGKWQDTEKQKEIIVEKHKLMVAKQKQKHIPKDDTPDKVYMDHIFQDSAKYKHMTHGVGQRQHPQEMMNYKQPISSQPNQQMFSAPPCQTFQQSFTGNTLMQDALHMWYEKERQKQNQQKLNETDQKTMAMPTGENITSLI
ncbi:serine-rich adhesin for platelets-like isoform X2 [Ptychodera flava]|uniref:serine-rich adhesin for platelets-like isoform X2 n=1 Tax=Ptychodera flava TaxID=63121 RepID=UPI00396A1ED1